MSKIRTHYDNLKVARNASDAVIQTSYETLIQSFQNMEPEEAQFFTNVINEAYEVLNNPIRRAIYDKWIEEQENPQREETSGGNFDVMKEKYMIAQASGNKKVNVQFTAPPLGFFFRGTLAAIVSMLVIPAPWMAVWFYRWCVEKIKLTDKTEVSFSGDASQIWLPMMVDIALSLLSDKFLPLYFQLLVIPVQLYIHLIIIRWFWINVIPSCGTKLSFVGTYFSFLGWYLLSIISIFTVVGWAWVGVGYIRWFCRNLHGGNNVVEFHGNGWNVLWRTVVFSLSCSLIIPIPWITMWLIKWYISNISITKTI